MRQGRWYKATNDKAVSIPKLMMRACVYVLTNGERAYGLQQLNNLPVDRGGVGDNGVQQSVNYLTAEVVVGNNWISFSQGGWTAPQTFTVNSDPLHSPRVHTHTPELLSRELRCTFEGNCARTCCREHAFLNVFNIFWIMRFFTWFNQSSPVLAIPNHCWIYLLSYSSIYSSILC